MTRPIKGELDRLLIPENAIRTLIVQESLRLIRVKLGSTISVSIDLRVLEYSTDFRLMLEL